jgi:DsbC/DsbD-like thiol-disulfide interchange protein
MARRIVFGGIGLALVTLAAVIIPSSWAGGKVDPVKVKASAGKVGDGGKQTVTVELTIDKGWHVYANPVGNEDLEPAKTVVEVKSAGKPVAAKVNYPAGTPHTDKAVGTFSIYEGQVTIQADVQRAAADAGPLEVSVKYQACNATQCLTPKKVTLNVP